MEKKFHILKISKTSMKYCCIFIWSLLLIISRTNSFANEHQSQHKNNNSLNRTYYVEPGPKSKLQEVIDNAKEGDRIILKSGDHFVESTESFKGIVVKNKKGIHFVGEDKAWIKTKQGWVKILKIDSSENISITNVGLIHDFDRGHCFGSVIEIKDSHDVRIIDSIMNGSGTVAIDAENSTKLLVSGGTALRNTEGVFDIKNSKDVLIQNMIITENDNSGGWKGGILNILNSSNVVFVANAILNNQNAYFKKIINSNEIEIVGNAFTNNTFNFSELSTGKVNRKNLSQNIFFGEDFVVKKFSYAMLVAVEFNGTNLFGADFSNASLLFAKFKGANLGEAKFGNAILRNAEMKKSNLIGAKLDNAILNNATFIDCDASYASFREANFKNGTLKNTPLYQSNFDKATLRMVDAREANLSKAILTECEMQESNFTNTNFDGANLSGAILTNADFSGSSFKNVDFRFAVLNNTKMVGANLSGANFENAILIGTSLKNCNFSGVKLTNSIFLPKSNSLPEIISFASVIGFLKIKFKVPALNDNLYPEVKDFDISSFLNRLKDEFRKSGLRNKERETIYLIRSNENKENKSKEWFQELIRIANYVLFDVTCAYGSKPFRPLKIIMIFLCVFSLPYWISLKLNQNKNSILMVSRDIEEKKLTNIIQTKYYPFSKEIVYVLFAIYFSLLSAFRVGFREINIGNWITILQPNEFQLKASGWTRTISGLQSLISVYLLSLTVLSFFGRPFDW